MRKIQVISRNERERTAQIVIVFLDANLQKRSATHHVSVGKNGDMTTSTNAVIKAEELT
jgi:hypothetical protein